MAPQTLDIMRCVAMRVSREGLREHCRAKAGC